MGKLSGAMVLALISILMLTSCGNQTNENKVVLNNINNEIAAVGTGVTSGIRVIKVDKTYSAPSGDEQVSFAITLDGQMIKDVKVDVIKGSDTTRQIVDSFASSVNDAVVGKTLAQLGDIHVIGGASLTTQAFSEVIKDKNFGIN